MQVNRYQLGEISLSSKLADFINTEFGLTDHITAADLHAAVPALAYSQTYRLLKRANIVRIHLPDIGWCYLRPSDWKPIKIVGKLILHYTK